MRMRIIGIVMVVVPCLVAAAAPTAHAEDWQWRRGDYDAAGRLRRHHGGIAAELATYAGDNGAGTRRVLESPLVGFWYAFSHHFALSADWGMAFYREGTGANKNRNFRFGDPYVAGYYVGRHRSMRFSIGGGITLPAATVPDRPDPAAPGLATRTYQVAAAARGFWNIFLWIPQAVSLVVPGRIEAAGTGHLLLAADGALGLPIFLYGQGAAFVMQAAGEVGYRGRHGAFGGRFQFVWWAVADRPFLDRMAQMSVEPFVRVDFGKPFITARLTINLDHPAGFSFDNGGIWALHLGAGTEF